MNCYCDFNKWKVEIENFFIERFDKKVNIELLDFNSSETKSGQCYVVIKDSRKMWLAWFKILTMPGCCGIAISTYAGVNYKFRGKGIGQFLHKLRIDISKTWGYGIMMCTDVDDNHAQKHILEINNWERIAQFQNPRTSNIVNIHTYTL